MVKNITFIFNDIIGGISTMNIGIIDQAKLCDNFNVRLILLRNIDLQSNYIDLSILDSRISIEFFEYNSCQNKYFILKRLNILIEKSKGDIITNDGIELLAIKLFGTNHNIFHIIHDLYNFQVALNNRDVIDYFICHTVDIEKLLLTDPNVKNRVFYLPFGIDVNENLEFEKQNANQLTIISLSRLVETKGVHHLIKIEDNLRATGVKVSWIIIGNGPEQIRIKNQWANYNNIEFISPSSQDLRRILKKADIFISLSEFEGYGISLLEAMSNGLVPIITKLPVGIHSMITNEQGLVINEINFEEISSFIIKLNRDRDFLNELSEKSFAFVSSHFNSSETGKGYQKLFNANLKKHNKGQKLNLVSEFGIFDKRWIPNYISVILKSIKSYAIS